MSTPAPIPRVSVSFSVTSADKCPLYSVGDRFSLNGLILTVPAAKQTCLILADDILRHLTSSPDVVFGTGTSGCTFPCGGCDGRVELSGVFEPLPARVNDPEKMHRLEKLVRTLGHFSLFKTLDEKTLRDILPELKVLHVNPGAVIIRQGQVGEHLHIILEGSVKVLASDKNILLATLGPGEVFGEMSLLSGNVCTASIQAETPCRILKLDGNLFREMVQRYPSMQRFIFQLLSHRLRSTNLLKESQVAEGVQGNLADLSLPEFLQALNISRKSGVVRVVLSQGAGMIAMVEGQVVHASYAGATGCEAFYATLAETQGTFTYAPDAHREYESHSPLGEFMNLLMEGFVRMDEAKKSASPETDPRVEAVLEE